jgi:hypothetical protein
VPTEAWRLAIVRWGDPAWTLAVILSGQHEAAQAAVVDAFCASYRDGTPDDPEHSLYQALVGQRIHFDPIKRRPLLSAALRRVAPADRLLIGLWLLRDQNGEQLSLITGDPVPALVARLTAAITVWARARRAIPADVSFQTELAQLVAQHLAAPPVGSSATRSHVYTPHTTVIDQLRTEMHELTRTMHLPPECPVRIERCLLDLRQAANTQWWQRTALWQFGLVALTIALLLWLVIPRGNRNQQDTAGPLTAQSLVEEALQRWSMPTDRITHRRVWSIDPQRQQAGAVVTDVWLPAGGSAEHRIEVRRGQQLTEWQIADGNRRLNYGAIPSESPCPWTLSRSADTETAFSFRIAFDEQRATRDARLKQGAYGLGYLALQRALAAPDLRSFGTRVVASRTFATLIYSDSYWGPSQQVVLRIDPASGELYGVQTVSGTGAQGRTRDLWRVDVREDVEFIPSPLPEWSEAERIDHLVDPTCLLLTANDVQDLRTTLDASNTRWYLPSTFPAGLVRGAIIAPPTPGSPDDAPASVTAQFVGPGRFLAISSISWQPDITGAADVERGKWRIARWVPHETGITHMTLHLQHKHNAGVFPQLDPDATGWSAEQTIDSFVATINVTAQGWAEDELMTIVDQLVPTSPTQWVQLRDHFVSPQPLGDAVRTAVDKAIMALEPPPNGTIITSAQTTTRSRPALPPLADPYHVADELWAPESTQLRQTLVYGASNIKHFDDRHVTGNSALYVSRWSDGTRFVFGNNAQGWAVEGDASQLGATAYPVQPGVSMLAAILQASAPITVTDQSDTSMIESRITRTQEELNSTTQDPWNTGPWTANLHSGTITYRVWLDRVTSLPRRMEIIHGDQQIRVQETAITERRVTGESPAPSPMIVPVVQDDMLLFHWSPGAGPVLDERVLERAETAPPLIWTETVSATMQWQLDPVGANEQLSLSAFKAARWFNLSRLSSVHRALYRMNEVNDTGLLVTQGPKNIMRHVIRYGESTRGADAMPWTYSRRFTVTINGREYRAWLLAHNEVAAIVIEMDARLVHVMGLRGYLEGPQLLKLLTQLTITGKSHPDIIIRRGQQQEWLTQSTATVP